MAYTGSITYNRILQAARDSGDPIGPQHHRLDAQLKKWERRQKNLTQLASARESKRVKQVIEKVRTDLSHVKEIVARAKARITQEDQVAQAAIQDADNMQKARERLARENVKKLTDAWKSDRTDHIKSVGNGL